MFVSNFKGDFWSQATMSRKGQVSVNDLLRKPFLDRPDNENLKTIVLGGRPQPLFSWTGDPEADHLFLKISYARSEWLTTCPKRAKVFCWPCLLLGDNKRPRGIPLKNHERHFESHARRSIHRRWVKALEGLVDEMKRPLVPLHNSYTGFAVQEYECYFNITLTLSGKMVKKVKKLNFYLFCLQYEITKCFEPFKKNLTVQFELPWQYEISRDRNDRKDGNVTCFQDYLIETYLDPYKEGFGYDEDQLYRHYALNGHGVFRNRRKFHNDLIHAIRAEMIEEVRNEVNEVEFVTVRFIDLRASRRSLRQRYDDKSTFIIVLLRYVYQASLIERYVGYLQQEQGEDVTAKVLMAYLQPMVSEFALEDKLVAVSVDDIMITIEELRELASLLIQVYPQAMLTDSVNLVNYLGYRLWSTSVKCGAFVQQLTTLRSELYDQRFRMDNLGKNVFGSDGPGSFRKPSLVKTCSFSSSNRAQLISFFQEHSLMFRFWREYEEKMKIQAYACWRFLADFSQIFLMRFFKYYIACIRNLERKLEENSYDKKACSRLIEGFGKRLTGFTRANFDTFWCESLATFGLVKSIQPDKESEDYDEHNDTHYKFEWDTKSKLDLESSQVRKEYIKLMDDTVNMIQSSVDFRYSNFARARYFSLVDPASTLNQQDNFAKVEAQLASLGESFPEMVNEEMLKVVINDLKKFVIYQKFFSDLNCID